MTNEEITRLIELAGKARKGETRWLSAAILHDYGRIELADAEYIAAANPETIRSLAEEVLRLREVAKEARRVQAARLAGSVTETWPEGGGMDGTAPQRVTFGWEDHMDWTPFDAALASLPSPDEPTNG